jgi:hypothetical protein
MHRKLLGMIRDSSFWCSVAPQLTIDGSNRRATVRDLGTIELEGVRHQLHHQGYFRAPAVCDPADMACIEAGLDSLTRGGWPALFVFLFDQPWMVYGGLDGLLQWLLGPAYRRLAACWAWRLERSADAAGWPPHRDRNFRTLNERGEPQIVTLWVAVTDATPDNGCIHIVPATRDPSYSLDLTDCTAARDEVCPLPAQAGTVLGWNHQLLHWGGRASSQAASPRMSLSAEFQRREAPLFDVPLDRAVPTFPERLAIVGKQLIGYQHMQPPTEQLLDIAHQLVLGTRYA